MITPEGIELSWIKRFECHITGDSEPIFGKGCVDSTMIFTPKSTGIYHIKISDAKFNTNIKIISGMVNPSKKPLVFFGAVVFWFIGVMFIAFVLNHEIRDSSKKQALIALMISLITTYVAVQYTSM